MIITKKQAKDLQMKENITVAGIMWSKFAEDNEGNAYMLADENFCDMAFGKNNDWRGSPIREKLNDELYHKVIDELGSDALITIQTDLFSHDGLRNYGKCEDKISLLTYDLYRNNRENIMRLQGSYWTCTPDFEQCGRRKDQVVCIRHDYSVDYDDCDYSLAVRPFFILKSIFIF